MTPPIFHPLAEDELFEAIDQFPYSIDPSGIFILAVAHQKRRSNYWKDRL